MFGRSIPLFRILGFEVRLDLSWLLIAVLVTWSLATAAFPALAPGLAPSTYWLMGVAGTLGLFACIVLHELGHSVVARRCGMQMRGITLFVFGGVAQLDREPPTPRAEFLTAIGGPVVTVLLAGLFMAAGAALNALGGPVALRAVAAYLATINIVLLLFNLVPAFPLDGGRVLRAALWAWKRNLRWATRIAASLGAGFGYLLIALGVWAVLVGNLIGGMWWFLLGFFIRSASAMSYQQVILREALRGESVERFMSARPISVPASLTVDQVVDQFVYRHHHKMFPVVEGSRLVGCLTIDRIKALSRSEWPHHTAGALAVPCSEENTITPGTDAVDALARMRRTNVSRLLVVEAGDHDRLVGILALRDLLQFLALKLELEGEEAWSTHPADTVAASSRSSNEPRLGHAASVHET